MVVELLDSDGDGLLGFEDLVKLMEAGGEEDKLEDLREAFAMFDVDNCGFITPKNLRKMLKKLGESKSTDECKMMISQFDLDGDGVLSFEEFRNDSPFDNNNRSCQYQSNSHGRSDLFFQSFLTKGKQNKPTQVQMVDSMSTPPPRSATDLFSDPLDAHPLWFKPNLFLSPTFDSESYISELRTFVPFDTLRSELQAHLASLNHELIDLINRDYADFVNLSTKLVDVDAAVVRMRAPLLELREKIEGFRGSVDASLVALRNGLQQRSEAAAAREVLELLLDTFHVVSKVEKLIKELPSVPADWSNGDLSSSIKNAMSNGTSLQPIENGTNFRETQSMLLERIAKNSGLHVFDFLANSILKEVLSAIQKGKPGAFSPGRPTEFLMNYKSSLDFLAHLEGYCPSRSAVAKFRSEAVYAEFMKQWNVGVYFSLRFQEIAGALDSALAATSLVPVQNSHSGHGNLQDLTLKQSATLLESLRSCWREDVLILSCSDKFLRLSLQLLARYSNWLSSGLAARKTSNTGSYSGYEWAISLYHDFVYIIHDITCLAKEVCGDYVDHVLQCLSSCSADILDLVKQSILQGGKSLNDLAPLAINAIIEALVDKAVEDLRQVKGITATYRMTNKPLPVRHSPYVSGVLRPLKGFLDGERAMTYLTKETRNELLLGAATNITGSYYELAAELVSVARKTESSLQRIRQGAQRRGGASSDVSDNSVSDTDKICMQLFLDIQASYISLSLSLSLTCALGGTKLLCI
ncbi:hypothetical protein GH714_000521 [Hevea brasiliensis]|uniref:Conserved oligomeric Golgi complex subunit 2 n=1 Tax=Hevea brasiliensis TaxID=3981 RepID=A0A6A6LQ51_HEVBR|nr:hypothetical protein GH714_000521 [Hevea brasiliensis]